MNRTELIKELAAEVDMPVGDSKVVVDALQSIITRTVKKGEPVTIAGFAKFARVDRPARIGRNPATGEQIKIKAKRAVKVTALKAFKDEVMGGKK